MRTRTGVFFSLSYETGGARGSRTPDLLNAIQALSQLSYGPVGCRMSAASNRETRGRSALIPDYRSPIADSGFPFLLVFDIAADDVGNVGVFFLLLLDKSGVVESFINLHLLFEVRLGSSHRRFRPLALGIGLFQRNELGFLRLGGRGFLRPRRRRARCSCGRRGFRPRASDRRFYRHYLAGVR